MTALPSFVQNLTKPTRYLSCAETAKLIRQALKEAFPEIKFSVRSSVYSGGASIRVNWNEGPTSDQVKAIADAGFDGMQDLKTYKRKTLNGEPVSFGADYVFVGRDVPDAKIDAAAAILAKCENKNAMVNVAIRCGLEASLAFRLSDYSDTPSGYARYFLLNLPAPKFEGRTSKLADSITYLGED